MTVRFTGGPWFDKRLHTFPHPLPIPARTKPQKVRTFWKQGGGCGARGGGASRPLSKRRRRRHITGASRAVNPTSSGPQTTPRWCRHARLPPAIVTGEQRRNGLVASKVGRLEERDSRWEGRGAIWVGRRDMKGSDGPSRQGERGTVYLTHYQTTCTTPTFRGCLLLSFHWPPPIFEGHRPMFSTTRYCQYKIINKIYPNSSTKLSIKLISCIYKMLWKINVAYNLLPLLCCKFEVGPKGANHYECWRPLLLICMAAWQWVSIWYLSAPLRGGGCVPCYVKGEWAPMTMQQNVGWG